MPFLDNATEDTTVEQPEAIAKKAEEAQPLMDDKTDAKRNAIGLDTNRAGHPYMSVG